MAPGEVSSPGAASSSAPGADRLVEEYAGDLLRHTNEERARHSLPLLEPSVCAAEQAVDRARDLVGADELTHAPLDGVLRACAPVESAAENLSRGRVSAQRVVEAWMGSPGHRVNVLDPEVTEAGVGCVPAGGQVVLCSMIYLGS